MTLPSPFPMRDDPAGSEDELQLFIGGIADALRGQVEASPILAAPRLTSLRERLSEIADELDWLGAALHQGTTSLPGRD